MYGIYCLLRGRTLSEDELIAALVVSERAWQPKLHQAGFGCAVKETSYRYWRYFYSETSVPIKKQLLQITNGLQELFFMGTSKNYPFGFWADFLLHQCVLKSTQYIQYSVLSNTFGESKSLAQNLKKQFLEVACKWEYLFFNAVG